MDLAGFCQVVGNEQEALEFLEANNIIRRVPPGKFSIINPLDMENCTHCTCVLTQCSFLSICTYKHNIEDA